MPGGDGSTTYSYQGNITTVTDPAGKWKTHTTDAMGNLIHVTEPAPEGGTHETSYAYNLLNQMTQVSMPRTINSNQVTQTRTFNYDLTTGRLTSAVNPENGTVSYTYNTDGTLSKKTDAKNQQVQYTYDTYGRVTEKRDYASSGAEDLNNRVDYSYNVLGQVASTQWGQTGGTPGQFLESYGYGAGNLMASKTLQLTTGSFAPYISGSQTVNFSYNLDGQISGVSLPTIYLNDPPGCLSSPWCPQQTGPNYVYSFDTLGRHTQLKETVSGNVVANGVNYGGPAGQLSALSWTFPSRTAGYTDQYNETRQYNARGQMTRLQYTGVYSLAGTPPSVDQTYTYSSTANDGRLWQMSDAISGEVVQYQYDLLGRLTLAQTTGPQWGESFSYDGFGNLTSEVATKGTAFTSYQTFDPTTNRLVGGGTSYDANGNLLTMAGGLTMSYDEENRMAQAVNSSNATETDIYNPSGQLVYRLGGSVGGNPPAEVYIYGPQGQRLRFGLTLPSWSDNNQVVFAYEEQELYFAGKLLEADDRVGTSAVIPPTYYDGYLVGITTSGTFPYGELRQTPALGDRYATYLLDTTTNLNYAQHRWYSSQVARFTTADPSGLRYPYAGADPQLPQSWNRYGYAEGDPINFNDPSGLNTVTLPPVVPGLNCSTSFIDYAAQFGESIQQLFDSDQGILGVMSFFEQEGSGSGADAQVWAALDWTFINQYRLSPSDKAWFYGPHNIPGSFAATVTTGPARSQVFTNGGQLTSGFTAQLLNILTGSPGSDDCAGLAVAFDTASGVIEAANGAGAVLVSPIPDPYPNALQFGSNGYVPGHGGYVVQSPAGQIPDGDNVWTFFSDVYNPPRPTVRRPPPIRVPRPRHQVGVPQ